MSDYRYILEKGSKKYQCPSCQKQSKYKRYIDTNTGEYLPFEYGKCDRIESCQYFLNPYTDGYSKEVWKSENEVVFEAIKKRPKPISSPKPKSEMKAAFIPFEVLAKIRCHYDQNVFIQNLLHRVAYPFGPEDLEKVISMYHIGTIHKGYRKGAIAFPFIDQDGNIRAIQVKQFNKSNHTKKKGTGFIHSMLTKGYARAKKPLPQWLQDYNKNDKKVSCLFGAHLLKQYPNNPIALVEAPKTAIYATLYFGFPSDEKSLLWLGVYNLSSLVLDKCTPLKGRYVYLFPDLSSTGNAFKLWSKRANEIEEKLKGTKFVVSDLLEQYANDEQRKDGGDIADFLIKQDWRNFRLNHVRKCTDELLTNANNSKLAKPSISDERVLGNIKVQTLTKLNKDKVKNLTKPKLFEDQNLTKPNLSPKSDLIESVQKVKKVYPEKQSFFCAWVNPKGQLILKNPSNYTIHESVKDYNQRTGRIDFREISQNELDTFNKIKIDIHKLQTLNNEQRKYCQARSAF